MDSLKEVLFRKEPDFDDIDSLTEDKRKEYQLKVIKRYSENLDREDLITLEREKHVQFLLPKLFVLPQHYMDLEGSRVWCVYWILHSLELLSVELTLDDHNKVINFLKLSQHPSGGFGGGPGQYPHLGTTYAAVSSLCILSVKDTDVLRLIDLEGLKRFIQSCRCEDGSFRMAPDNEIDTRAIYCAASVARLVNIYTPYMFKNTVNYLTRCQNYDGGFGAQFGGESNGGLSFCAYAALILMNHEDAIHRDKLFNWVVHRQMSFEGGFQGRPNKLVDSCYSYWSGVLCPLIQAHYQIYTDYTPRYILNREANQYYLLMCCQAEQGGFSDRLRNHPDLYHTCYSLSSLSLSQHSLFEDYHHQNLVGVDQNLLERNHPVYNISEKAYNCAHKFFYN